MKLKLKLRFGNAFFLVLVHHETLVRYFQNLHILKRIRKIYWASNHRSIIIFNTVTGVQLALYSESVVLFAANIVSLKKPVLIKGYFKQRKLTNPPKTV